MDKELDISVVQPQVSEPKGRLTFRKGERLHHHALVEQLFDKSESVYAYPLRMFWIVCERERIHSLFHGTIPSQLDCLQMMVTVPKKKFKHAVDRVWLRRRIREAYRLHRHSLKQKLLDDPQGRFMQLAFIYVGDSKREYASIEKKMKKLLEKAATLLDPSSQSAIQSAEAETSSETQEG